MYFHSNVRRPVVLAIAVAALALFGCVPRDSDSRTKIVYAFWGSLETQALDRKIVAQFELQNPDIKVELLPIGARYDDKLQTLFAGGSAPDVLMVGIQNYREWLRKGLLESIDDLLPADRREAMMPVVKKAFEATDGHYYASPIHSGGHVMFVNLDALERAGVRREDLQTWEGIEKIAPRLASQRGDKGAATQFAVMVPMPITLLWSFGGTLFDDPFNPTRVTVNTPESKAAMEFIRSLHRSGYAVPSQMLGDQGGSTLFRDGKVALYFNGRWATPELRNATRFRWDVMPMPSAAGGSISRLYGSGMAIWSGSRRKEAAKRFVKFYTSRDGFWPLLSGGRYVPVYRDWAFDPHFLSLRPPESMEVFAETLEEGKSEVPLYAAGAARIDSLVQGRMEQLVSQPEIPVERVLSGLEADLNRWLNRQRHLGKN